MARNDRPTSEGKGVKGRMEVKMKQKKEPRINSIGYKHHTR